MWPEWLGSLLNVRRHFFCLHVLPAQEYSFADGTVLAGGESLKIWSGKGAKTKAKKAGKNNLYWTARYIWNNHGDEAVLVNEHGEEVSSMAVEPEAETPVDVTISDLDLLEDTVTVTNNGDGTAELSGWKVLSRTGDQVATRMFPLYRHRTVSPRACHSAGVRVP